MPVTVVVNCCELEGASVTVEGVTVIAALLPLWPAPEPDPHPVTLSAAIAASRTPAADLLQGRFRGKWPTIFSPPQVRTEVQWKTLLRPGGTTARAAPIVRCCWAGEC